MAVDLTQSFLGKHFEKIVVGVAALVFVGAVAWFIAMRQPQDRLRIDVARLVEQIDRKSKESSLNGVLSAEDRVRLGIDEAGTTVTQFDEQLNGLPGTWDAVARMVETIPTKKGVVEPDRNLAASPPEKVMLVEDVQVAAARGVTSDAVPNPLEKLEGKSTTLSDVAWAGCVGRFDLTAQLEEYSKGNAPIDPNCPIAVSGIELRRREMKADGTWSDWADVRPVVPPDLASKLPAKPADATSKAAVIEWYGGLRKMQAEVRRMPFYALVGEPDGTTVATLAGPVGGVEQPGMPTVRLPGPAKPEPAEETPKAAPKRAPPPKPASGASPFSVTVTPETPTPGTGESMAEEPTDAGHVYATVWASDATVEPGRTYQYQMRVSVVNPVWSLDTVKDEKARWTLEFSGDWCEPSEPITVPTVVQFYFVGTFGDRVNLELHRWIHGEWLIVPSAPSNVGSQVVYIKRGARGTVPGGKEEFVKDVSLSPDAMLVDVVKNFPYRPKGGNRPIMTNVLVFADAQGRLSERIEWEDRARATEARIRIKEGAEAPAEATRRPVERPKPAPKKPRPRPRPTKR